MVLAAINDTGYDILLLVHIAAVIVAFAHPVLSPVFERQLASGDGDAGLRTWAGFSRDYIRKISLTALVVVLVTGILLIVTSEVPGTDDLAWEFSDPWISIAFLVWLAIAGVLSALTLKGHRLLASGDAKGRELLARGGPIVILLLLVMLYLMIFKPGA